MIIYIAFFIERSCVECQSLCFCIYIYIKYNYQDETIIKKLASTVVGIYIDIINNSTDKDCVMHAMEGIGEFVCEFDLSVFDLDSFKLLITSLLSLLYERVYFI